MTHPGGVRAKQAPPSRRSAARRSAVNANTSAVSSESCWVTEPVVWGINFGIASLFKTGQKHVREMARLSLLIVCHRSLLAHETPPGGRGGGESTRAFSIWAAPESPSWRTPFLWVPVKCLLDSCFYGCCLGAHKRTVISGIDCRLLLG